MSNQIPNEDEEFFDEAICPGSWLFGELKTSIFISSFITPIGNKEACSVISFQEKERVWECVNGGSEESIEESLGFQPNNCKIK